jgi:hypothetical protein
LRDAQSYRLPLQRVIKTERYTVIQENAVEVCTVMQEYVAGDAQSCRKDAAGPQSRERMQLRNNRIGECN